MSEETTIETPEIAVVAPEEPTNIIPLPAQETAPVEAPATPETPAKAEPKNIQELIANIDIENVTTHEIIVDLIAGIQQLAVRGTIALGLLERMAAAQEASEPAPETPAAE